MGPTARPDDRRTLQFGPLWVLSALAGTYTRFDADELDAFWDVLVEVALRTPEPARSILTSTTEDRTGLLLDFALDGRPVVSGLSHLVALLDRMGPTGPDYRAALLRIAAAVARNRGPFGRRVTAEDEQKLLLVAALLGVEEESPDLLV